MIMLLDDLKPAHKVYLDFAVSISLFARDKVCHDSLLFMSINTNDKKVEE